MGSYVNSWRPSAHSSAGKGALFSLMASSVIGAAVGTICLDAQARMVVADALRPYIAWRGHLALLGEKIWQMIFHTPVMLQ